MILVLRGRVLQAQVVEVLAEAVLRAGRRHSIFRGESVQHFVVLVIGSRLGLVLMSLPLRGH